MRVASAVSVADQTTADHPNIVAAYGLPGLDTNPAAATQATPVASHVLAI